MDHLPQGRLVARFEAEHDTILAVVHFKPAQFDDFAEQLESVLREGPDSGLWERSGLQLPQPQGQ